MDNPGWATVSVDRPARARARDPEKTSNVASLFKQHYEPLVKSLCFVALDRELAADAAQEAFFQLYRRWDRIGQYDDPAAWVYRVAINKCRDHRRALARANRLFERLAGAAREDRADPWAPDVEFTHALRRLPTRQRAAAALHYVAGLPLDQVAAVMDISEGTVKSHLHRARQTLRVELGVER
jgi:RNA polymerase sigma-70 factor, ECF subfamily